MIINFKRAIFLLFISSVLEMNSWAVCQAQSTSSFEPKTTQEVIRLITPNGDIKQFSIQNISRKNESERVAQTLIQTGVDLDGIAIAISLVEVGANPEAVTNLMLALNGLKGDKNQVSVAQLNRAINSYNTIINKSNLSTLQALKKMTTFMEMRSLLQGI